MKTAVIYSLCGFALAEEDCIADENVLLQMKLAQKHDGALVQSKQRVRSRQGDDYCAQGCPIYWIGDELCDDACMVPECEYDHGDCDAPGTVDGTDGYDVDAWAWTVDDACGWTCEYEDETGAWTVDPDCEYDPDCVTSFYCTEDYPELDCDGGLSQCLSIVSDPIWNFCTMMDGWMDEYDHYDHGDDHHNETHDHHGDDYDKYDHGDDHHNQTLAQSRAKVRETFFGRKNALVQSKQRQSDPTDGTYDPAMMAAGGDHYHHYDPAMMAAGGDHYHHYDPAMMAAGDDHYDPAMMAGDGTHATLLQSKQRHYDPAMMAGNETDAAAFVDDYHHQYDHYDHSDEDYHYGMWDPMWADEPCGEYGTVCPDAWKGDGICDDGTYGEYFPDCFLECNWQHDGGDCDHGTYDPIMADGTAAAYDPTTMADGTAAAAVLLQRKERKLQHLAQNRAKIVSQRPGR